MTPASRDFSLQAMLVLTVLIPVLFPGCTEEGAPTSFTTRDSAGVQIVESTLPGWGDDGGWLIGDSVLLDLTRTGGGPNHEFYRVVDGAVLNDGRVLLADDGTTEIRVYSREGVHLSSTGREGEGPGEYRQIMDVSLLPGDSVGVFSWPNRFTVLSSDLAFGRVTRLGERAEDPRMLGSSFLLTLEVYASVLEYEGGDALIRAPLSIVRRTLEGTIADTIWVGPGFEEYMFSVGESSGAMIPLFGRRTAVAVRGASILVGTSERMEFQVLDSLGRTTGLVRVPSYDLSLNPGEVAALRNSYLGSDPPASWREVVELLPEPGRRPAYGNFMVDSEGFLWAGELVTRLNYGNPRRWEIFAPNGQWMGAVETPARFRTFQVGPDYVLGVLEDELDVEHPQLLSLDRGS